MNLSKIPPAPWTTNDRGHDEHAIVDSTDHWLPGLCFVEGQDIAEFVVLARNAFDAMMRRGWGPAKDIHGTWFIQDQRCLAVHPADDYRSSQGHFNPRRWPDPFTALVEADKWLTEQEKGGNRGN